MPAAPSLRSTPEALAEAGLIHPGWKPVLTPLRPELSRLADLLAGERAAGHQVLPAPDAVLRALRQPPERVRVLIVGQDPYPTPGHAMGLAFSVSPGVRPLPRSLANVLAELHADLGHHPPASGDLSSWADAGVLLLNRVLTVRAGASGSHARQGWEQVTDAVVRALVARRTPLVAVLWGRQAQAVAGLLGRVPAITSAHPSPLSARGGFFGSRPFSRANELLLAQGGQVVDWSLPSR